MDCRISKTGFWYVLIPLFLLYQYWDDHIEHFYATVLNVGPYLKKKWDMTDDTDAVIWCIEGYSELYEIETLLCWTWRTLDLNLKSIMLPCFPHSGSLHCSSNKLHTTLEFCKCHDCCVVLSPQLEKNLDSMRIYSLKQSWSDFLNGAQNSRVFYKLINLNIPGIHSS